MLYISLLLLAAPDMRRRVDIEARYNVTCEAYKHSLTNNLLSTVAEQRYSVVEHICGGCKYVL